MIVRDKWDNILLEECRAVSDNQSRDKLPHDKGRFFAQNPNGQPRVHQGHILVPLGCPRRVTRILRILLVGSHHSHSIHRRSHRRNCSCIHR